MANSNDDAPSLVLIRYPNLSGALVIVTATEYGHRSAITWHCTGCLHTGARDRVLPFNRNAANDHAGACRALPQPDRTTDTDRAA